MSYNSYDKRNRDNENMDEYYMGSQKGYTYDGDGHYYNNEMGPGKYAERDAYENIHWHSDM